MTGTARTDAAMVAESADVDPAAMLGNGTRVWHLTQSREGARIGPDRIVGRGHAPVHEPAAVEDGALIGAAVVCTNDYLPRAVIPEGELTTAEDWTSVAVTTREGASIGAVTGARAVCVAPVTVGRWATVAAAVAVGRDDPDVALVAGVPARRTRWVGHAGVLLQPVGGDPYRCPSTGRTHRERDGRTEEEPDPR